MTDTTLPDFDALWNYSEPAETEAKFREILPLAESSGDRNYLLELLTQIARTQGLQRKFDDAHATLDTVEQQLPEASPRVRVRYLLERGRVFNSSRNRPQARPHFLESWELGSTIGEEALAVDAAHMMGIIEPGEESVAWNLRAMEMAEASSDPDARRWLGSLLNNLGWTFHDRGEYERSLELFEKALAFRLEHEDEESIRIARWCVARTLRSLARIEEALALQRQLLALIERKKQKGPYIYEEMAECLYALGQAEEATPFFGRAYDALSEDPWFVENNPERLQRLKELGGK